MRAATISRVAVLVTVGVLLATAMVSNEDDRDARFLGAEAGKESGAEVGAEVGEEPGARPEGEKAIETSDRSADPTRQADASDRDDAQFSSLRESMVTQQLAGRDIRDPRVLDAMRTVPRHRFVPEALRDEAYRDRPLPIGKGQTISQPYIVALMTQLVSPAREARVLDVGTGSGYQAAVLAEMVDRVYSIEIICELADSAREVLHANRYTNVTVHCGDGYRGWKEHAPFDAIVVAAAPDHIPQPLIDQLAPGGRLVIPVGSSYQELILIEKQRDGSVKRRSIAPVRFVPMTRKPAD